MSKASKVLESLNRLSVKTVFESTSEPEEGWCIIDPLTSKVLQGPYLDKDEASIQSKKASVTSRLYGSKPTIKFGKKAADGEYMATRAVDPE